MTKDDKNKTKRETEPRSDTNKQQTGTKKVKMFTQKDDKKDKSSFGWWKTIDEDIT